MVESGEGGSVVKKKKKVADHRYILWAQRN